MVLRHPIRGTANLCITYEMALIVGYILIFMDEINITMINDTKITFMFYFLLFNKSFEKNIVINQTFQNNEYRIVTCKMSVKILYELNLIMKCQNTNPTSVENTFH